MTISPHPSDSQSDPTPSAEKVQCSTCGPTATEPHPHRLGVTRCANCKEWLAPIPERPWAPEARPTVTEWLDWFLTCPRAEQERLIGNLMEQGDLGWRCFVTRHEVELQALRERISSAPRGGGR